MSEAVRAFVANRFAEQHGAQPCMNYDQWHVVHAQSKQPMAALAVRPASNEALFLETYLSAPIEQAVSLAFGYAVPRDAIVEIGCLAAVPTAAMLTLWNSAAASLVGQHRVAVATLTLPLRKMFARVGLPFVELATADPDRLYADARGRWGSYYDTRPIVCAGEIAAGCAALQAFGPGARQ
ncbi:thermostable hemolysin [Sphingobium sp. JS3065]|uniref:thermostable hemolysin n=1 Tax=Sphingobium sp. JS3065 TaxID=2970925 RepID=UPI002265515F|nr:thermostable hemolysin [Sphingobium sp. JS3065]UZW57819.1 thermostable hemolysin [Sphingobium sp. JS3065]